MLHKRIDIQGCDRYCTTGVVQGYRLVIPNERMRVGSGATNGTDATFVARGTTGTKVGDASQPDYPYISRDKNLIGGDVIPLTLSIILTSLSLIETEMPN